ncbi:MAG: bifunctional phosphoglucose/phosphomannose isomerase [Nanoarchaeota archaeon]
MGFTDKVKQIVTSITGTEKKQERGVHKNVHEVFLNTPEHLEEGLALAGNTIIPDAVNIQHITFVGMGGSVHPGFLLKTYLENIGCKKQINLVRDYTIPAWVSKKGFLFLISYSGNTAETLEAYRQAYREGYKLIVMTSGGKLKEYAEKNGTSFILLPSGYQPRHTVYHMFGVILQILQNSGIIKKHQDIIAEAIRILHKPIFEEMGKNIADKLDSKLPIIYATPKLAGVSQRWKICFNENTKIHAFYNDIPELNHNEMNGYVTKQGNFHVIFLVDEEEQKWHRQRVSATKQIVKEYGYTTTEISVKGPSYLARLLSAVCIGDWTSYYYAQKFGMDPGKVEVIEKFKKMVNE